MLVPKVSVGSVGKLLSSEPFIAVGSSVVLGTVAAAQLTGLIQKIPFANEHVVAALIVLAVIIGLIAIKLKSGVFRAIVIGSAGGVFFIGLLQVPSVRRTLAQIGLR